MDTIRPVAVGEKEFAVRKKRVVRGHESVAPPSLGRLGVLIVWIKLRSHGRTFLPDQFAFGRELGEVLQRLISSDVKELVLPFRDDLKPMPASLELAAESADKPAIRVEHKNGRVLPQV